MAKARVDLELLEVRPFSEDDSSLIANFSCGDTDLDEFIRDDALRLQQQHTVSTYLAFYESRGMVGYVSLMLDAVKLQTKEKKKLSLKHRDHPVVPALKVARLAVDQAFRESVGGLGELLMTYAASKAFELSSHAGCRLITLDAYPSARGFYDKLGFVPNREVDREREKQRQERELKAAPDGDRQTAEPEHNIRYSMRFDLFSQDAPEWLPRG